MHVCFKDTFSSKVMVCTRGDQKVRRKKLPFLHRSIFLAAITAPNTVTHMQLIGYNMLDMLVVYVRYSCRQGNAI